MGISYKINEKFFETWSPKMAYVLGYIYADGDLVHSLKSRGRYIKITSTEIDTLVKIKGWLNSEHTIATKKSGYKNGKPVHFIRIGNKNLYLSLERIGLYQNKSLTIKFPKVPKSMVRHFIRGYFDGDGCVYLEKIKRKSGKIKTKKLNVIFTSGSELFLKGLSEHVSNKIDSKEQKVLKSWTAFQTRYSTKDSEKIFKLMYKNTNKNEYLERKHAIFIEHFTIKAT